MTLLGPDDPDPVLRQRRDGASPFVIVCDHAGNRVPQSLGMLGLQSDEFERHAAWDIGAAAVSRLLGESLGAGVVEQTYSRLVIDCNRAPGSDDSIVTKTDIGIVPGNVGLDDQQREARRQEIFVPYHRSITSLLDHRARSGVETRLVSIHSFTSELYGSKRPWHVGILHNGRQPLAAHVLQTLRQDRDLVVGDNQPYALSDASDYTLLVHGQRRGLDCVEIEVRQDLIADGAGQTLWAAILSETLSQVAPSI